VSQIIEAIEGIATSFETFKKTSDARLAELAKRLDEVDERREQKEALLDRPSARATRRELRPEHKVFHHFAKTGKIDPEAKSMSIAGGAADGQAFVPEIIADEIISQALAVSEIAGYVKRTPVSSSDYVRLVNKRGATASWSSETGTRNATATPQLREIRPTHGELYAVCSVTNWLLNDSKFDVAAFIAENVRDQFATALDAAIYNGDGSNKPTGIFNTSPSSSSDFSSPERNPAAIQYVTSTGDAANDVVDLLFALKPAYRRNARFAMSSTVLATLRKLRDSNGSGFLWQQNLSQGIDAPDGLLVGKPVTTWENMPSTYSTSPMGFKVLCGDWKAGYELTEIGPMTVLRDPYTTKGSTVFYFAQRFGGKIVDNNALKVLRA
jgi:HK97 family phage major capsid protein